ncbi:hypothetical protein Tsubulata_004027 [Turnera subulata]|uniref:Uncharacterized protein n=1 Tax=Turnera subulata TaxID=218843 RepID=A0A9Q0GCF9_9ROSI|nr:hypothetical protein Tsubulata_004027 [Turnera subulata]
MARWRCRQRGERRGRRGSSWLWWAVSLVVSATATKAAGRYAGWRSFVGGAT